MIRKILDISTAHLPRQFFDPASEEVWDNVPLRIDTQIGVIVWVPDDPDDPSNTGSEGEDDAVPPEVIALWRYARARGCDYILLDRDADIVPDLPRWRL